MLQVEGLVAGYRGQPVLEGLSLEVQAASFVSLVGPSGAGKSTLLRAIAGLLQPWHGSIRLGVRPDEVGFLFQDDALLPWRTARENVALGLRIRGWPARRALSEADRWLERMGLSGLGGRFPHQLSGGQRKRVALTQVLCLKPRLLLMDEPFASLDAILRLRITQELVSWVEQEGSTVVLVTHDLEEALAVSDHLYLLSKGPGARIRRHYEVGFPRPRDIFAVRARPEFGQLLNRVWEDLEAEVTPVEAPPQAASDGQTEPAEPIPQAPGLGDTGQARVWGPGCRTGGEVHVASGPAGAFGSNGAPGVGDPRAQRLAFAPVRSPALPRGRHPS